MKIFYNRRKKEECKIFIYFSIPKYCEIEKINENPGPGKY